MFTSGTATPDWSRRVDHPFLWQIISGRDDDVSNLAASRRDPLEFLQHLEAGTLVDETIDCPTAAHKSVRGIDDDVRIEIEERATDDGDVCWKHWQYLGYRHPFTVGSF